MALEVGVLEQVSCLLQKHGLVAPLFVARWQNHVQLKCKLALLNAMNELMTELFHLDPEIIG